MPLEGDSRKLERERERLVDAVMDAASGPHFSGLRLDSLRISSPSTPSSPSSANAAASASINEAYSPETPKQPFVIGVSGGTASGKTTVCDMIIQQLHDHRVVLVNQDSFYRGLTAEEAEHANDYNFDHPDAFDTEQLLECMGKLKNGFSVNVPIYDFKNHCRCSESFRKVNASDVIILEGILVFHDLRVRNLMDMKIFVDTVFYSLGRKLSTGDHCYRALHHVQRAFRENLLCNSAISSTGTLGRSLGSLLAARVLLETAQTAKKKGPGTASIAALNPIPGS